MMSTKDQKLPKRWCILLAAVIAIGTFQSAVLAGPIENVIEIDGDNTDGAASGTDWCEIIADPDNTTFAFSELVPDGDNKTIFTTGGSKDELDIPNWRHKDGSVPDKDDMQNGVAAIINDGISGHQILAFAADLTAPNGDAQIGFWLLQDAVGTVEGGLFSGVHLEDDLLVLINFIKGGKVPEIEVYQWKSGAPVLVTGADAVAATNDKEIQACTDWEYQAKGKVDPNRHPATTYFEGAIDLTALGLGGCFESFILETRASQSIDAVLKDFIGGRIETCSEIRGQKREACGDINAGCLPPSCDIIGTLANWEIRLLDEAGNLVTQDGNGDPLTNPVCTDADGRYEFLNLTNGVNYIVAEVVPDRLEVDETAGQDLNCNGITGEGIENFNWAPCFPADGVLGVRVEAPRTCCATLGGIEYRYQPFELTEDVEKNFTNFKQPIMTTLSGAKFCDKNGNGVLDVLDGDFPLAGFCIVLTKPDGSTMPPQVTDEFGAFSFLVVSGEGPYEITEDLSGAACGSDDKSGGWVATTTLPLEADPDPGVILVGGLDIGNASIPTIDCNKEDVVTTNDSGKCTAEVCFTPTAENECGEATITCTAIGPDGEVTLEVDPETGERCGDFPAGCPAVSTVTCTVTTDAGQTATCSFTVTVTDDEDPELSGVPDDAEVQCDDDV
ncbi:MAG: hypothetical protein ACYTA5_21860, partial [Planctomycetota bacterium]